MTGCDIVGATLLVAKLDLLSRNAGFIFALRDPGVDFVCCDMPDANTLAVGVFAVIAQHGRKTISKRTKDALAAKQAHGAKLGTSANFTPAVIAQVRANVLAIYALHQRVLKHCAAGVLPAGCCTLPTLPRS